MRLLRIALVVAVACAALAIDVGESVRTGSITVGAAHAKKHRKHKRGRKRRHHNNNNNNAPPATEM
jgi:hypothetical protein